MKVLGLLRAVAVLHALAVCLQPLLGGVYLNGSSGAMRLHEPVAMTAATLATAQFVLAVLWWRPGRGPGGPALLATAIVVAESFQITAGFDRQLALHIPLGTAIVAAGVTLAAWTVRVRRPVVTA